MGTKKTKTNLIGQHGERLAVQFLQKRGYYILQQNYRCKIGELDIIAWDGSTLCFVEVRTRATSEFGYPFETVSLLKQRKIIRSAQWFLLEKRIEDQNCRFDIVSVLLNSGAEPQFELLQNTLELP